MPRVHSKHTVIIIDGNEISTDCTDSRCEQSSGTEDNTTYGKNSIVKDPTLLTGAFSCSGKYPAASTTSAYTIVKALIGTKVNIKYRPEGTGSGLPQDSFDAVITKCETTAPVGGYRLWAMEAEPSDDWDTDNQA